MNHDQIQALDDETAGGMSSTILVLGCGTPRAQAVREADSDWTLRAWAPPKLAAAIDAARAKAGDCWLVAVGEEHATELDRDPAVIAYAPAWRRAAT